MTMMTIDTSMATTASSVSPKHIEVDWDIKEIRKELHNAAVQLSHHCLKLSTKWVCEQIIGLPVFADDEPSNTEGLTAPVISHQMELYAKSLMELGEYAHAAAMLSQPNANVTVMAPPLETLTKYGIFLRSYALYMAGEQRKNQQDLEIKESLERQKGQNPFLSQLREELQVFYEDNHLDAFGLYVYGLVLKESLPLQGAHSPQEILVESLKEFPCNWSAWLDLASVNDLSQVQDELVSSLGTHYMYHFFSAHRLLDDQSHELAIDTLERLVQPGDNTKLFSSSPYVASQLAVGHYHLKEFHMAEQCFQQIHRRDPYRLEDLDVYSNILYVQDNTVALSKLAHTAMSVDKYRPETCCIVGNYYSLKTQRTKAIQYFQRALKLNSNYTGAWTLMGHEYVELKNTAAAMEAYRRAADIHPKDYRAWYGLGQAYEILGMPLYALFYYRKACQVRSYDPRMWSAVAGCYLLLGKRQEAILAYEKAIPDDHEGIATTQLASLYKQDGKEEKAAQCYRKHLELRYLATTKHPSSSPSLIDIIQGVVVQATEATALLFLAHYHVRHEELETAALCASRLLEYPGPEKEEGKAVLREIRARTTTSRGRSNRARRGFVVERRHRRPPTPPQQPEERDNNEFSVDFSP